MASINAGQVLYELDTNLLFEKFTVGEVRDIEKKTRAEIENKKEELRQMVGERYRDLIEAADTIKAMKNSVEKVVTSITSMEDFCKMLKDDYFLKNVGNSLPSTNTSEKVFIGNYYSIATQIRCLLSIPEKIWNALDSQDFLQASQLYLLAMNIHSNLQIDGTFFHGSPVLFWFPVISHEWTSISHFKNTILRDCQRVLKSVSPSEQTVCNCMCAIILLEDKSSNQAFIDFLESRKNALLKYFCHTEHLSSIKDEICNVVQLVIVTLYHTFIIFYSGSECDPTLPTNMLLKTLNFITNTCQGQDLIFDGSSATLKHCPPFILNFKPLLKTAVTAISKEELQTSVQQWIDRVIPVLSEGISKLLNYINSIKALAGIRDAVWEILENNPVMQSWILVCQHVLNRSFLIWEELLRPLFLKRCQDIIQIQFDNVLQITKQLLNKTLADLPWNDTTNMAHKEISSYVWTERPGDLPFSIGWMSSNKNIGDGGTLIMKVKTYTPAVQNLCNTFDSRLKTSLEDFSYFMTIEKKDTSEPFDRTLDSGNLHSYLQTTCNSCINRLLEFIDDILSKSEQILISTDKSEQDSILNLNRVILLARFLSALSEISPNLQQCMNPLQDKQESNRSSLRRSALSWHQKQPEDPMWSLLKSVLLEKSQASYQLWCNYTVKKMLEGFTAALLDRKPQSVLKNLPLWDEIDIQEESEDGRTITSTVKVPMQASWYVHVLLFNLCQEVNNIGGHSLSRLNLLPLISQATTGILSAYETLLLEHQQNFNTLEYFPINQTQALQIMFDLQFIAGILSRKSTTQKGDKQCEDQLQKIIDQLEGFVDPFDLDVFTPHIKKRLLYHIQRCTVLLGTLTCLDKLHQNISLPQSSQQKIHNLVTLASPVNRFSLLPLSTQSDKSSHEELNVASLLPSQKIQPSKINQESKSLNSSLKSTSNSSSLYGKLEAFSSFSSSWFGGQ